MYHIYPIQRTGANGLQAEVFRAVMEHSDICICSGFVPDRNKLCELAEQYDGVLVIFENISDELTML